MKLPRYGLRSLLLLMLCCAVCSGIFSWAASARRAARQSAGLGIQRDVKHWPYVLRKLIESDQTLQYRLTPCGLTAGFDHSSIWRLDTDAPMIDFLMSSQTLEPASVLHPKANQLILSIPGQWPKQNWQTSRWYATPGFGNRHIEGPDLYLIAIDSDDGTVYVYHENHF
jgi:hypothetical protein